MKLDKHELTFLVASLGNSISDGEAVEVLEGLGIDEDTISDLIYEMNEVYDSSDNPLIYVREFEEKLIKKLVKEFKNIT